MNAAFSVFSPQEWKVLRALDTYRFLTTEQMLQAGISTSANSLRENTLAPLRHHKYIYSQKIGFTLPDVHYLTEKGLDKLCSIEECATHTAPSNNQTAMSALFAPHRFAQVDFHIQLNKWAENHGDVELLLELQDFIHTSTNSRKKSVASTQLITSTEPRPIIPDGTFAAIINNKKIAVYLVEIHKSTETKAVTEKLIRYFDVIEERLVKQKYGYSTHPIICSVHEKSNVLKGVKTRLNHNSRFKEKFSKNIVFHTLEDLTTNFTGGWHFADDSPVNPFPIMK